MKNFVMLKVPLVYAITILFFHGCANKVKEVTHYPNVDNNFSKNVKKFFSSEREDNRREELGLALSGGGVRSASFSIGALEGLHNSGLLDKVDVLSTVSGGGYAGYWFINAMYELDMNSQYTANRDDLFRDCFPAFPNYLRYSIDDSKSVGNSNTQRRPLAREGCNGKRKDNQYKHQNLISQQIDLLSGFNRGKTLKGLEYTGKVLTHIPFLIPHHVGNTIFDWDINTSPLRKYYQNGIERTYGAVPKDIEDKDVITYFNEHELTFDELKDYTEENWNQCSVKERNQGLCRRMPLWIINATAGVGSYVFNTLEGKTKLKNSVFSMTPFSYGSDEYGYVNEPMADITVPKAVSISGAALDSQGKLSKGAGRVLTDGLLHLSNFNLGYSINNYNPESANRAFHALLPWPLYYLHGFKEDENSTDIYLSDGGHSDNLGAYALIMRGVKNIIIVDGTQDGKGKFGDLLDLRNALKNEHKIKLVGKNNSPLEKYIGINNSSKGFNPFNTKRSIFNLKATNLPKGLVSNNRKKNVINIIYIKSSIDPDKMNDDYCDINKNMYPCTVAAFYRANNLDTNRKPKASKKLFPHHSTGKNEANFSVSIYHAYRDLAKYLSEQVRMKNNRISVEKY